MQAVLLVQEREAYGEARFTEITIWHLPRQLPGSHHQYKYRLALIDENICVLRYDNEAGKGDHKHHIMREEPYNFTTMEALLSDFDADVRRYLDEHPDYRQPND